MELGRDMKLCVVIPVYNHGDAIGGVVEESGLAHARAATRLRHRRNGAGYRPRPRAMPPSTRSDSIRVPPQ